jgi:hypothetical protein
MIHIADRAMKRCNDTVRQLSLAPASSKCVRLIKRNDRFSISFEAPRSDDKVVLEGGRPVVAVPDEVVDELDGKILDLSNDGAFVLATRTQSRQGGPI